MERKIEKIKGFRQFVLNQIKELTTDQLNKIPEGYHNNIIWNIGHMINAQQNMCYIKAGMPVVIDQQYFSPYLSGTRPETLVDEKGISTLKELFISSIDQLQTDFDKKLFNNYSPSAIIPKVYGFEVNDINGALEYLLYHEGYHGGCIASLMHLV
jgi:DinB superfamily